jgi:hypothetical protein
MRKCESTKEDVFVDCLPLLRPFVLSRFRGENSLDLIVGVAVALPPRDDGLWRVGQQHACFSNLSSPRAADPFRNRLLTVRKTMSQ